MIQDIKVYVTKYCTLFSITLICHYHYAKYHSFSFYEAQTVSKLNLETFVVIFGLKVMKNNNLFYAIHCYCLNLLKICQSELKFVESTLEIVVNQMNIYANNYDFVQNNLIFNMYQIVFLIFYTI